MNTFHLYNTAGDKVIIVRETDGGYNLSGFPQTHFSHIDDFFTYAQYNEFKSIHNLMYAEELGSQISIFDM
ncbi:DUF3269 family protein [Staphylococcus agnetis]|uniref:DUF3269 family protein n=1 Tax=Staphylococcus agnetis TaxID=985762 RepID=UPI0004E3EB86|nr:DUF3269 family protein [Staphylococcus agnetis]KFE41951.1 hypothetical protein SAGN_06000 [Staphylococcus agnetis]NJH66041.1 DUF3269 family protein [Staphylococcus agnetis]NJH98079.1 DUF3269 family protein [Staphylococcus agnetis]PTH45899.1 hypothetical protein BU587_09875 [Staphylococcus agnetis]PTH71543.1 hypothetical protein BU581_11805 [Staphylococcus agnetis]